MADYSVGNLFLDISAIENGSVKTLSTVTRSLNSLYKSVDKISKLNTKDFYTKLNSISRILTPLKDLGSSFKSAGAINTFANGLQKITKLDVAGFDKQLKSLTVSLRPFLQEINKSTPALNAFASAMNAVKGRRTIGFKQLNQFGGGGNNLAKSLNLAGIVGKIYFIRNYTKQLGQSISKIVQMGMDFTETLNLWTVAMGNNIASAEEFISKMNKAYGIAEETLMRYQATFRNMLSTLGGVSTDTSYALSEYIMQMALDYASLYNTSIEKAMTVFQAVLSGQVRPIRSVSGYDITETTIYELYQQLGGTKTMRQLTQTEKRLLRIYAVFQQMERSGAVGDLAKTLNSTANTTRVLSETLKNLGTYIGVLLDEYLAPLLTYVTAFALTVTNIVKVLAQPIIDQKKKELGDYGLAWEETTDSIDGASEAYDEFVGKLLDFDKFRSLSGGDQYALGIDEKLLEGLMQYESVLKDVKSEAQELAKEWTSLFIDDTGNFTKKAKELWGTLKDIAGTAGVILGIITLIKAPFLAIGAYIAYAYTTNEDFRESCNNLFIKIKEDLLPKAKEIVDKFIDWVAEGNNLETVLKAIMGLGLIGWVTRLLGTNFGKSAGILGLVKGVVELVAGFQSLIDGKYEDGIAKIVGSVDDLLWGLGLLTKNPWIITVSVLFSIIDTTYKKAGEKYLEDNPLFSGELGKDIANAIEAENELIKKGNKPITLGGWLRKIFGFYSEGGMPDKGTLFVAGEAGAEMVYNTPSGQSGVANVQQISQASYSGTKQALVDWWKSAQNDIPAFREVSKTGIYEVVDGEARRRGRVLGTV